MSVTNSLLEFLAHQYDNVVKYDADGKPSIFVRFPKMKSSDLDASLPDHTHPAFIVNGVEQDEILLGKYTASSLTGSGSDGKTLYSLPNMPPAHTRNADQFLAQVRAFGGGVSGMTVADRGFILLLAQKNGWNPGGNSDYGHCYKDATRYDLGKSVKVGDKRGWRGWLYECLQAHTTSMELYPDVAPMYWKRIKHIGGVEAYPNMRDGNKNNLLLTLTGSGPLDWYLGGTPGSLCDVVGNQLEQDYGYRIVAGELQIMENNDAAHPETDLSASSAAWKAILPNASDDGYALVAPGTAGTLHWTWTNSKITLDTVAPALDEQYRGTNFKDLAVNSANLPHIPYIVRELGLFPTQGSAMKGYSYMQFTAGERIPRRGGSSYNGGLVGLGCEYCYYPRSYAIWNYGVRPRSLLNP
jgi:sulfatase modifying factor 1